ncbi:hypothetical protein Salat_1888300 [Sesamum alatum]|uniref:RNase H type-1 domain-containing protein n=1 Tax=Sesamum alatum TaxID=300844 RepID=A0AAE1Y4A9_9LAMI|nr:hypothetical protein Salat_1888300 [Sesamum alatum]
MENKSMYPHECVDFAVRLLNDFQQAIKVPTHSPQQAHTTWTAPTANWVNIHFDASLRPGRSGVGLGTVARDYRGRCIAWRTSFHNYVCDAEHGETLAARQAVEMCLTYGWNECIIEGDCALIIQKLICKDTDMSSVSAIIHDIQCMCPVEKSLEFRPIRRTTNNAAHLLARAAFSHNEGTSPPLFLLDTLRAEAPD